MSETQDKAPQEQITTKIWKEDPEPDNPFAASACYCSGYDVYGDLLGKISLIEYIWLLFKLEPPTESQAKIFESLAVALANPGPRDHSVRAAMNAGVGGSTRPSALIAAIAVGAGNLGGSREVYNCLHYWQSCGTSLQAWLEIIKNPPQEERTDVWPEMEHPPGFDPYGVSCSTPVRQLLSHLVALSEEQTLKWLNTNRLLLEKRANMPLTYSGVAAATLFELKFTPEQAEMIYLILRLPGAAAHALEQEKMGFRRYPFFADGLTLTNDPGPVSHHD